MTSEIKLRGGLSPSSITRAGTYETNNAVSATFTVIYIKNDTLVS